MYNIQTSPFHQKDPNGRIKILANKHIYSKPSVKLFNKSEKKFKQPQVIIITFDYIAHPKKFIYLKCQIDLNSRLYNIDNFDLNIRFL